MEFGPRLAQRTPARPDLFRDDRAARDRGTRLARLDAILRTVAKAFWRDQKSLASFTTNNFFLVSVIFLQRAGMFVYLVLALILLFPLSSDPLRTVPPERLGLWHLTRRERMALRAGALVMNPLSWIMAVLLFIGLRQHFDWTLAAVLGGMLALSLFVPPISGSVFDILRRCVPALGGWFGFLVAKDLRQMLSVLDVYCALVVSAAGFAFRIVDRSAPPEALLAISILIVLALSSYAQSLFGLDGAAIARCRLMPLRGWQVLASKDAAFLVVAALLTAPLAPVAGISAACVALAIGHAPTVYELREQRRGRFSTGASLGNGIVQAIAMAFAAGATFRVSVLFVLPCAVAEVVSLWWYGRAIDLRWREELSV